MSLVERLLKQALWHERHIWNDQGYSQRSEDMRALLTEAAQRITALETRVSDDIKGNRYIPIGRERSAV